MPRIQQTSRLQDPKPIGLAGRDVAARRAPGPPAWPVRRFAAVGPHFEIEGNTPVIMSPPAAPAAPCGRPTDGRRALLVVRADTTRLEVYAEHPDPYPHPPDLVADASCPDTAATIAGRLLRMVLPQLVAEADEITTRTRGWSQVTKHHLTDLMGLGFAHCTVEHETKDVVPLWVAAVTHRLDASDGPVGSSSHGSAFDSGRAR